MTTRPPASTGNSSPSTTAPETNLLSSQASPAPAVLPARTPPRPSPPITDHTENVNKCIIITERATYNQLLNDVGRKHLLVEFFAPWCGACMLINKTLEELAIAYNDKLVIAKVNVEECEEIAVDNGVTMMPAFMLMKEKQILEKFAGSNEEKLTGIIKKFIGDPIIDAEAAAPRTVSTTINAPT